MAALLRMWDMTSPERGHAWLDPAEDGQGRIIVISGPSGSGKSTLVQRIAHDPNIHVSVSATTRPRGPNEVHGVDYYFLSRPQFEQDIRDGLFIEHAEYGGCLYGTPREPVRAALAAGKWCLLEIEVRGALQIRERCPDALMVFIEPPSDAALRDRLSKRKRDLPDAIDRRLAIARREMKQRHLYDVCVVNDDLDEAVATLKQEIRTRLHGGPRAAAP